MYAAQINTSLVVFFLLKDDNKEEEIHIIPDGTAGAKAD
jgi:hypothetical protein